MRLSRLTSQRALQKRGLLSPARLSGDVSLEQRAKLCERDAPGASAAGLKVVQWMVETMLDRQWRHGPLKYRV